MQVVENVTYSLNEYEIREAVKNYLIEKTELRASEIILGNITLDAMSDENGELSEFQAQLTVTSEV